MTTKDAIKHLSYKIAFAKQCDEKWAGGIHIDALEIAVRAMAEERKKGKWIITDLYNNRVWHCNCSECGEDPLHFISGTEDWWLNKLPTYCPSCGAEMEKTDV